MREHRVRALLMGGQACISYGAAEFSRDVDLAIVSSLRNIAALRKAIVKSGLTLRSSQQEPRHERRRLH
jgi:hypothetical protein